MINPAKRIGQVKEYYFSSKLREIDEMRQNGHDVLNLGIGSPDLAPPLEVIDELTDQSKQPHNHAYQSYRGIPELRTAFASWYRQWFNVNLDPNSEILPLLGSKEGIMHISMAYLEQGDEALVPNPGYPTYAAVVQLTGANIRHYTLKEENNWLPDFEELESQDLSKVKVMWVNYPHMPTGAKANKALFEKLVDFGQRHRILICNDNPYSFILNKEPMSILSVDGAKEVALELNSLSKAHNMAGWRIGLVAGKAKYLQDIMRFKSNMDSGMFKPAQLAAVRALSINADWYEYLNEVYRKRRQRIFELLNFLGCQYDQQQSGLFVWANTGKSNVDGYKLSDELLYKAHVFITPGGIFGSQGKNYIRISLCNNEETLNTAFNRIQKL